ncbi:MAG: ATP-binding protein [Anaerolineae bacterium]|nr:transcriptional regulator [Anaerolineae bacterium]
MDEYANVPHLQLTTPSALNELAETLAALANGRGGTVLLELGALPVDDAIDRVRQAALMIEPALHLPGPRELPGQRSLAVTVPSDLGRVFGLDGRYLRRDGTQNRALSGRELRELLMQRGDVSYEEEAVPNTTADALDWIAIERYAARVKTRREATRDVLIRRGCLIRRDGKDIPTYAGMVLFGKDPQQYMRGAQITAVRFGGASMGDVFTRQDIVGALPEQIRQAEAFILDNLRRNVRLTGNMARDEEYEYPLEAAREMIVNAVSHRDYSIRGDDIRLFIFADRLEVSSPGRLPGPVTVDNIADERFSRNPAIVQVLSDMGFIERLGYGVNRIINLMRNQQLPPPEFTETAGGFRVRLFNRGASVNSPFLTNEGEEVTLNVRQEAALAHLRRDGVSRITNGELQAMFPNVHSETIRRDLADLVGKGMLLKRGEKRGSYYILLKAKDKETSI